MKDCRHKIEVNCLTPDCRDTCVIEVVPYLFHGSAIVVAGKHLQHHGRGTGVDLVMEVAVDGVAEGRCAAVVFAFQRVLCMTPDDLLRQLRGVIFRHAF